MFNTTVFDSKITSSLTKTISVLSSSKLKNKKDIDLVQDLNSLCTKDQLEFVYNVIAGGYSSIQTFIDRKETVSVPGLGMFRYVEGKKISEDVKKETLSSYGYTAFNEILDQTLKQEISQEINNTTYDKVRTSLKNKPSGRKNVVLPFTLAHLR